MNDFFTLDQEPSRHGLPLLLVLGGITDAGSATSAFGNHLTRTMRADRLGGFDSDALFDYRQHRGAAHLEKGRYTMASLPAVSLFEVFDESGHSALVIAGPEPDLQWLRVSSRIAEFVREYDVPEVVYVGAIPWAAPHTRPVGVIGHGTNPMVLARYPSPIDEATVPLTVPALVELAVAGSGCDVVGFIAKVPQYVAGDLYEPAVAALAAAVGPAVGLGIPEVPPPSAGVANRLERQAAAFPALRELIRALETVHDEQMQAGEPAELPSGDELAAQIEEYLSGQ